MVAECGAPTRLKSDNAPEFKGKRWISYLESLSIKSEYTEAHHPNQNLAERRGGALKAATVHLLTVTGAPLAYWCFALEYMCLVRTVLARRSLNWLTPHECHWGERPDISVFRFIFWQPVWFYQPRRAFPRAKMLKGRFLGVAPSVGDAFCFLILALPDDENEISTPQVLARSVIRPRYPREDAPDVVPEETAGSGISLTFYKNDETTVLDDPLPSEEEEGTDGSSVAPASPEELWRGAMESSNDSLGAFDDPFEDRIREVIGPPAKRPRFSVSDDPTHSLPHDVDPMVVPLTQGQTSTEPLSVLDAVRPVHTTDNLTTSDITQDSNTPTAMPLIATDTAASNDADSWRDDASRESPSTPSVAPVCVPITQEDENVEPDILENVVHQLQREADTPVDDDLFEAIVGHEWVDGVLMLRLSWKTEETTDVPFTTACKDFPVAVADYILLNKVGSSNVKHSGGRFTRWARQFKRTFNRVVRRLIRSARGCHEQDDQSMPLVLSTNLKNGTRLIRRVAVTAPKPGGVRKRKKPGRISRPVQIKYGVEVPRNVRHAFELDEAAGNTLWADAIRKVASLLR
ncbi:hypothetical protein MHU86_7736 [Fragilaria crotonensis]|nr:hypothetical protein MHU86_7736 [Fragilaria crotonensis]